MAFPAPLPNLPALLAPTWAERAAAEDVLRRWLFELRPNDPKEPFYAWPEPVQSAIAALQPNPATFLAALLAFWADVALRAHQRHLASLGGNVVGDWASPPWGSAALLQFPMNPAYPPRSRRAPPGQAVFDFICHLGAPAAAIETQLLGCLRHPDPQVVFAAEVALGTCPQLSDSGFAALLGYAERTGRNGYAQIRTQALARHLTASRMPAFLEGITPTTRTQQRSVRCRILGHLPDERAALAAPRLLALLREARSSKAFCDIAMALPTEGALGAALALEVLQHARSTSVEHRRAAARNLAAHDPVQHCDALLALAADADPWVKVYLAEGLLHASHIPAELLRCLAAHTLGDYDGYDGEPHDRVVRLLIHTGQRAAALPEIAIWFTEYINQGDFEGSGLHQTLDLLEALGDAARPLAPELHRLHLTLLPDALDVVDADLVDTEEGMIDPLEARLQALSLRLAE